MKQWSERQNTGRCSCCGGECGIEFWYSAADESPSAEINIDGVEEYDYCECLKPEA